MNLLLPDPGDRPALNGIHAQLFPIVPPPALQRGAPGLERRREECLNGQGTAQDSAINGGQSPTQPAECYLHADTR